ncbi:hypothetical protein B566_EDAN006242 [Ephemera danica]|nr:hypothetical protein B566_EDAN006242 [Ephemera danica]
MESTPPDLQAKYQKLAAEYSKIRAQASVLKKAVVDEQTKTADLKDLLKEKEQSLRKADQEMESLNFRNQQLTKRSKYKKGKKANHETSNNDFSQLVDEELAKQMAQNANLVIQLQEKDDEQSRQARQFMERITNLEQEVQQLQKSSADIEVKYQAKLKELSSKKQSLTESVSDQEKDVQKYSVQVAALGKQQEQLKAELDSKLITEARIISKQIQSIDKDISSLQQQEWALQVISQVGCFICDLTSQLSDFHTHCEHRLHLVFDSMSPIERKLSGHLKENARYLRALEQGYKEFQAGVHSGEVISLETIPSLNCFAEKLDKYNSYLQKLLPYQLLSLNEENSLSHYGEALKEKNNQLGDQTLLFASSFMKLTNYIKLLASQSQETQPHSYSSQNRFLEEVLAALGALHSYTSALSVIFKEKIQLECDIPNSSEQLSSTNKYLVDSLVAMVNTIKEIQTVLLGNRDKIFNERKLSLKIHLDFLNSPGSIQTGTSQKESQQQQQDKSHRGSSRKEALGEQLQNAQQRLTQLEQDREHWKQEFQLLQMKHIKEQKKNQELEEQLHLSSRSSATTPQSEGSAEKVEKLHKQSKENSAHASPAHSAEVPTEQATSTPAILTGLLGQITCPFVTSTEIEAREEEVKVYFTERINQLVAEKQLYDGKSVSLRSELQEELHTTKHNYETQLSLMSEHLANMNDKLAIQKDEIDQLKYQLGQKVAKKGKQK